MPHIRARIVRAAEGYGQQIWLWAANLMVGEMREATEATRKATEATREVGGGCTAEAVAAAAGQLQRLREEGDGILKARRLVCLQASGYGLLAEPWPAAHRTAPLRTPPCC